ncbi:hypothetical protein E5Q_04906 [Mixia osmundae IAM 14324]|uniref:Shugoshin C-terminal domain-containing protein n=1 Tax=Mixia osmundae (strain CBS 9802 / IAM 14324 / JCM 22182 / KY 12970) TaxID=764103 RepID=G7E5W3_MIXOS|nr:hypothetical protein E5Q_04906 [Mixia osmundae IAM 14324]
MDARRRSGAVLTIQQGLTIANDTLDSFRRKHVSQNREIIHKNSELLRTNTDLSRQLAQVQAQLMSLKADNLKLGGKAFQLEMQLLLQKDELARSQTKISELTQAGNGSVIRVPQTALIQQLRMQFEAVLTQMSEAQHTLQQVSLPVASPSASQPSDAGERQARRAYLSARSSAAQSLVLPREGRTVTLTQPASDLLASAGLAQSADKAIRSDMPPYPYKAALAAQPELARLQEDPNESLLANSQRSRRASPAPSALPETSIASTSNLDQSDPTLPPLDLSRVSTKRKVTKTRRVSGLLGSVSTPPPEPESPLPSSETNLPDPTEHKKARRMPRASNIPIDLIIPNSLDSPARLSPHRSQVEISIASPLAQEVRPGTKRPVSPIKQSVHKFSPVKPATTPLPLRDVTTQRINQTKDTPAPLLANVKAVKKALAYVEIDEDVIAASQDVEQAADEEPEEADEAEAREGRRSRKQVSYALPSLRAKMRQPEGYVPSIKHAKKPRRTSQLHADPMRRASMASSQDFEDGQSPPHSSARDLGLEYAT